MKVKVCNGEYIISSDSRQYTLAQDTGRKDKDGEPVLDYIGYYTHIDNLLRALMAREARLSKAESLDKYLEDVQKAAEDVKYWTMCMAQMIGKSKEFKKKLEIE